MNNRDPDFSNMPGRECPEGDGSRLVEPSRKLTLSHRGKLSVNRRPSWQTRFFNSRRLQGSVPR